jgi:DNA polymerase-1
MVPVLAHMEERGISVDRQILSRLSGEFAQSAAARLEDEIQTLAGERFNIGSPKQLGDILFGKLGLPGGARPRPASGRPRRRCWKTWRRQVTNCRARSSTGAS